MNKTLKGALIAICFIFGLTFVYFTFVPAGRSILTTYDHSIKKAEENNYENRKKVEDTMRSIKSSYNKSVNNYNQYKDSTSEEDIKLANKYKTRANNSAEEYNKLVNNSYIWEDNIPQDLPLKLNIIE